MTISNSTMVRDALGLIGVLGEVEAASSEQAVQGIRVLNRLMASWREDGIDLQYYDQADPGANCPIPSTAEAAVLYFLAFALAPYYGKQIQPAMAAEGDRLYSTLTRNAMTEKMEPITPNLPAAEGDWGNFGRYDINNG